MRTKAHWEQCKNLQSYHTAQSVALQLKEMAKDMGFSPHGVKVQSKQQAHQSGSVADARVIWPEGPEGWAKALSLKVFPGVSVEAHDGYSLSFYDI